MHKKKPKVRRTAGKAGSTARKEIVTKTHKRDTRKRGAKKSATYKRK